MQAPGHVFAAGKEPWLGQAGALDCLQFCSLSPIQANGFIVAKGFDEMISFTEIRPDKVQAIGKISWMQQQPILGAINLIGD